MSLPYLSTGRYYPDSASPQTPSDVAVIMPTILRPDLTSAVKSIYNQDFKGRIQIAIGVDVSVGNLNDFEELFNARPDNVSILISTLPYSTSARHGGIYRSTDGGSLRTILAYATNSEILAFLDDDNEYLPDHISLLHAAIQGKVWSSGQRILVDQDTLKHLGVDVWDSVGPNRGRFRESGGFIDPNCLMVNKTKLEVALAYWSRYQFGTEGETSDRKFFRAIATGKYEMVIKPTVLYKIRDTNVLHDFITGRQVL
jgi:glycosyltransferase involved in cell wall biosynthesis